MAEVAPMPMASEPMATRLNPGDRGSIRNAYLKDFRMRTFHFTERRRQGQSGRVFRAVRYTRLRSIYAYRRVVAGHRSGCGSFRPKDLSQRHPSRGHGSHVQTVHGFLAVRERRLAAKESDSRRSVELGAVRGAERRSEEHTSELQ